MPAFSEHVDSWYAASAGAPSTFPPLKGSAETDVCIIGGGYTGLSAARALAKNGTSVVVLERETIGWGASSRNAGITSTGLKAGMPNVFKRYGKEYGLKFWQTTLDMLELLKEFETEDGIKFDWEQNGQLGVAYKASHFEKMKSSVKWFQDNIGDEMMLVAPSEVGSLIGSDAFYGGVIDKHGAGLHPAKLVFGLAEVASRHGATLCEEAGDFKI